MQYLLLLHADENGWSKMTEAEQQQGMAAYMAYTEALKKAGALVGSNRLQPSRRRPRCASRTASRRCWTARMRTRRSNWAAIT